MYSRLTFNLPQFMKYRDIDDERYYSGEEWKGD